ncbi:MULTISPECIES: DEAD/DEAH box helicase family protein [Acinetobacter]|uniref:DEAD/DEAH box helicase family protein n=1 Tax=Acinetobacter TaxID=469 RepID=UPI002674D36C|nr:DEAD/DEAH box helicase family protein [Acinetobacter higginsii]MDO3664170.1 DEAD/DEAH box helicase family protein [Acinetobacter higginsii]
MAFKKPNLISAVPESPDRLFNDLPRRKHASLFDHQGQVLRSYVSDAINDSDVAIQLPTGSGKTLVGLLLAEWRRKKFDEKVVFLCPTKQLVNQVVEEANNKYGLTVQGFVGSIKTYSPEAKAAYKDRRKVAVTTYNSIFNTNPFFDDADIIIVDDAHAAENYLQSLWTFSVNRFSEDDSTLYRAIASVLKPVLTEQNFARMCGAWDDINDLTWVDKIPSPKFHKIQEDLRSVISSALTESNSQKYSWAMIRSHLHACQMYVSSSEILIKPFIPPTWSHKAFNGAKQRIFMSATLGQGGDLERLTGRPNIKRVSIPEGWDKQGIGRRFFIFPEKTLESEDVIDLRRHLMGMVGRSLVLTSNNDAANEIIEDIEQNLHFPIFTAKDLERGKDEFISKSEAVAVIANRYDGIDFPEESCRLLFVEGLSQSTSLQERFLVNRMGASVLFNERIQTRALQAIGRCTRGLNDYSAVVITGDELSCYLTDSKRRKYFHPELQAELEFGVEQSSEVDKNTIIENLKIFIEHGEEWEEANQIILENRASVTQEPFPAMDELSGSVKYEINWQKALWNDDFVVAYDAARDVLSQLKAPELKGYRALWGYLAGAAADMATDAGFGDFKAQARYHYELAKKATIGIPWLSMLSKDLNIHTHDPQLDFRNLLVMQQVEEIEGYFDSLGLLNNTKFAAKEIFIRNGLRNKDTFEQAQVLLGKHLGFKAFKVEADASPDPWWTIGDLVIVFEDHVGAFETSSLSPEKARQVALHPNWLKDHDEIYLKSQILPVLVTPVTKATHGAIPHLIGVSCWNYQEFLIWSDMILDLIRELRSSYTSAGDLVWRSIASDKLIYLNADPLGLFGFLKSKSAKNYFAEKI